MAKVAVPDNLVKELGAKVPKGGSSCASCKFLKPEMHCGSEYFIKWNDGSDKIPAKHADEYCSIWWEGKSGESPSATMGEALKEQRARK